MKCCYLKKFSCFLQLPSDAGKALADAVSENSSVQDLFYIVGAMKNLGQSIDSTKVSKVLSALLKKDESIARYITGLWLLWQLYV